MFCLESLKIDQDQYENSNLTLSLELKQTYFLTSENLIWLTNLYKFFKTRKYYLSGRWLVNNQDLSIFNETDFLNYSNHKISFCDDTLILNNKWTGNKIINFYVNFFKVSKDKLEQIQNSIGLNILSMKEKIKNLSKLDYMKLLICLSLIKNNEIIICNFIDFDVNDIIAQELYFIAQSIKQKLQKTFICFMKNTNELEKINLDDKKYWQHNKILTIGEKKYIKQKLNIKQAAKLFLFQNKFLFLKYIILFVLSLILSLMFLVSLSISEIQTNNTNSDPLVNNKVLLQIIGYISYFGLYICVIAWMVLTNKKNHRFTKFLTTIHENKYLKSILYTSTIWFIMITTGIMSFIVVILIMNSYNNINTNQLWYALGLFLYIIYVVVITICLGVKSNQIIKNVTLKETLIKIFIR